MKKTGYGVIRSSLLVILLSCMQLLTWAQDSAKSGSVTITKETHTTTTTWYAQPWVWIAGGAVFLLILVALLRGNSSQDREVTRTTVIKSDKDY